MKIPDLQAVDSFKNYSFSVCYVWGIILGHEHIVIIKQAKFSVFIQLIFQWWMVNSKKTSMGIRYNLLKGRLVQCSVYAPLLDVVPASFPQGQTWAPVSSDLKISLSLTSLIIPVTHTFLVHVQDRSAPTLGRHPLALLPSCNYPRLSSYMWEMRLCLERWAWNIIRDHSGQWACLS